MLPPSGASPWPQFEKKLDEKVNPPGAARTGLGAAVGMGGPRPDFTIQRTQALKLCAGAGATRQPHPPLLLHCAPCPALPAANCC